MPYSMVRWYQSSIPSAQFSGVLEHFTIHNYKPNIACRCGGYNFNWFLYFKRPLIELCLTWSQIGHRIICLGLLLPPRGFYTNKYTEYGLRVPKVKIPNKTNYWNFKIIKNKTRNFFWTFIMFSFISLPFHLIANDGVRRIITVWWLFFWRWLFRFANRELCAYDLYVHFFFFCGITLISYYIRAIRVQHYCYGEKLALGYGFNCRVRSNLNVK